MRASTVLFVLSAAVLVAVAVGAGVVPVIWAPALFVAGYAVANEGH